MTQQDLSNETLQKEFINPDSPDASKENLLALEEILNRETKEFNALQRLKKSKQMHMGEKIPEEELSDSLQEVASHVNLILHTSNDSLPDVKYTNMLGKTSDFKEDATIMAGYAYLLAGLGLAAYTAMNSDPYLATLTAEAGIIGGLCGSFVHYNTKNTEFDTLSNRIFLDKAPRTKTIPDLAHAYTAYLQHQQGNNPQNSIFNEGQARGVQKEIAKTYKEAENNEAFMYDVLKPSELKGAYLWACRQLGKEPNSSVLRDADTGNVLDRVDIAYRASKAKEPTPHALGNAIFSVWEANNKESRKMYKKLFQGTKYN